MNFHIVWHFVFLFSFFFFNFLHVFKNKFDKSFFTILVRWKKNSLWFILEFPFIRPACFILLICFTLIFSFSLSLSLSAYRFSLFHFCSFCFFHIFAFGFFTLAFSTLIIFFLVSWLFTFQFYSHNLVVFFFFSSIITLDLKFSCFIFFHYFSFCFLLFSLFQKILYYLPLLLYDKKKKWNIFWINFDIKFQFKIQHINCIEIQSNRTQPICNFGALLKCIVQHIHSGTWWSKQTKWTSQAEKRMYDNQNKLI